MIHLDATDHRILGVLQDDASLSNLDLARRAAVSPATCLRRVKRLRELGVIEQQVAILNPAQLGAGLIAIVEITLERQTAEAIAGFQALAVARSEVQQCYQVSPGPDFVLIVQVPDMAAYHQLVQGLYSADSNVRNVKAFFSVHRAKFSPRLHLPAL